MDNYIPSGKSFAVVSLDHLFLVVIFWMTMLFLTPGVLRRHETHLVVAEEDEDVSFSLSLSVCLSLSRARRGKEEQTTRNKKASPQSRRLTAAQKKAISSNSRALSFETTRKEEEEDARERVLSLLRAVLHVKEIERCDFGFFLSCASVSACRERRERERESDDDDGVSVVCGRLSLFPFFVVQSKRRKIERENEQSYCF